MPDRRASTASAFVPRGRARTVTSLRVLWLGAVAAAVMGAGAAFTIWSMYGRTLEEQSVQLRNVATLLAEQTARSIEQVELLMRAANEDVQRPLEAGTLGNDRVVTERLRDLVGTSPQVAGIMVLDRNGAMRLNTMPSQLPPEAERAIFEGHRDGRASRVQIGTPVRGVAPAERVLPMSRRVEGPGGTLAGVIVSATVAGYFEGLYMSLELGETTQVAMIRDDGIVLAGRGIDERMVGERAARHADWPREIGADKSVATTDSQEDAPTRLTAVARVPGMPVALAVSVARSETLRDWRTRSALIASGALLAAAIVLLTAAWLSREIDAGERLQTRVQEGEDRLEAIIQSAMDAIITVDDEQRIVLFNRAAEQVFGITTTSAVGERLDRLIPERFRKLHGHHLRTFGETGQTTRRMGGLTVLYGLRANGEEFPIDASISHVTLAGRRYYTVILRDITARLAAEQEIARGHRELAELSRAAQEALEEERRRVARELHDELGQALTAVKMDLQEAQALVPPGHPDLEARCASIRGLVDDTVAATRRIASDLRPLMLDDLGLGAAVDWLVQNFGKRTGVATTLHVADEVAQIGEPAASAVFRIVQESMTNVARHANATKVDVRIMPDGRYVSLRVADDGRGIDESDRAKRGSFGLRGIRERARLLGGEASIERGESGGTVVLARIPVDVESSRPGEAA